MRRAANQSRECAEDWSFNASPAWVHRIERGRAVLGMRQGHCTRLFRGAGPTCPDLRKLTAPPNCSLTCARGLLCHSAKIRIALQMACKLGDFFVSCNVSVKRRELHNSQAMLPG